MAESDPNLWLEDVTGERALKWVEAHNKIAVAKLTRDPDYKKIRKEFALIAYSKDRLTDITIRNDFAYNFWQDKTHTQGIWRRTPLKEYMRTKKPKWEILLDLDELSAREKKQWVRGAIHCLMPESKRCLITLSDGGKDAAVIREFDLDTKQFVADGFVVPEAKSYVHWKDKDHVWLMTDFGPDSLTNSGYPRSVRLWQRGTPMSAAKVIFTGEKKDIQIVGDSALRPEGNLDLIIRYIGFTETEMFIVRPTGVLEKIPVPSDADYQGNFKGDLFFTMRSPWKVGKKIFPTGALAAFSADDFKRVDPQLVAMRPENGRIDGVVFTATHAYLQTLENVRTMIYELAREDDKWKTHALTLPGKGMISFESVSEWDDRVVLDLEDFLVPTSQYLYDVNKKFTLLRKLPDRFPAAKYETHQYFAKSKDGTSVPYFVVHRKGIKMSGKTPTLINAYGGFEFSFTPSYLGGIGKVWLERGGAYVVANLRGGGEMGPEWHAAAVKEKRQNAYDDYFAVAEDLIARKISSPKKLGIMGGSNGGLLVGVALTQRPELYNAIVCQVPLLDMLRFHKMLAGASWISEYGDPDQAADRAYLRKYSPYQNLKAGKAYPPIFFSTSTKDDRVHPGHARKMAAKMESLNIPFFFYEHTAGGHNAGANLEDHLDRWAREYTYLKQRLMD